MGGTFDARFNINSQFGQLDSTITNQETGTITGNLYSGNGTHVLTNEGTITGNIDVEQRMMLISGLSCTVGAAECFADTTTTGQFLGKPGR